jgi:hypothetical protein
MLDLRPDEWLDAHFERLLADLTATLPTNIQERVQEALAIGCVDNRTVNASIIANDMASCFAIVVNQALISLISMLTQYAKLVSAALNPTDILFFEGIEEPHYPPAVYSATSTRILSAYGAGAEPTGPELKFKRPSEGSQRLEAYLLAMLLFIIGHELGHYLNGDLAEAMNCRLATDASGRREFYLTDSHKKEFAADAVGFDLVLAALAPRLGDMRAGMLFHWTIVMFFNFLLDISNRGSETHPPPSTRMLVLAHTFFGKDAASALMASFNDIGAVPAFHEALGKWSITDLLSRRRGAGAP